MNTHIENQFLDNLIHSRTIKIIILILFVLLILSIIANGVQGYYLYKKAKGYRELKSIIDTKSNCEKCPAMVETPAETTPTTTTPKYRSRGTTDTTESSDTPASSGSTDTQETVIPPPPPPSD